MDNQIFIAIFGTLSVFLTQVPSIRLQRFACIIGLISQPFFLYETYIAGQIGMLIQATFVTGVWMLGVYTYWIKPRLLTEVAQ